jgi:predicted ATPase/transcriptional regulator with XRE-family HTH domain/HPt (histidine-containing phosphotransfer) domain-containing protein
MPGQYDSLPKIDNFGSLLKYLRRRARLTQKELSIAVGYSESQISRLETNKRSPDKSALTALFIPALGLEREPEVIDRLLALAETQLKSTREDSEPFLEAPDETFEDALLVRKGNLPIMISSFIGRQRELEQISELLGRQAPIGLPKNRLLTLTGSGGVGKTRLSLRAAESQEQSQPDGAWIVELAPLTDPTLVARKIMHVFDLPGDASRPDRSVLIEFLRNRRMLLILDNCEHLVDAVAELTKELLERCPKLQILATSREPLGLTGEVVFQVPSLTLPNIQDSASEETSDAVRLFIDRAKAVQSDFTLTPATLAVVTQICSRLDGIPLAIELAAARVNVLSIEAIAGRLDNAFHLLTSGNRGLLPRQQSLRATIDWSYDLLSPAEQTLLTRLSVFAGRWRLEAAETICADETMPPYLPRAIIIDLIAQLVGKSLVVADTGQAEPRYHLHEMIRQYGHELLQMEGDISEVRRRHLQYYLQLCESWVPHLRGPDQVSLLDRLEEELDNIRAALTFSMQEPGMAEMGLRLMVALRWLWHIRGLQRESAGWLESLLTACPLNKLSWPEGAAARARALADLAFMRIQLNKTDNQALLDESHNIYQSLGNAGKAELVWLLNIMEINAYWNGDMIRGKQLSAEAVALAEELGEKYYMAEVLEGSYSYAADNEEVLRNLDRALYLRRSLGDIDGIYSTLFFRSYIYARMGKDSQAIQDAREALKYAQMGKNKIGIARVLFSMGRHYFTTENVSESFVHFHLAIDTMRSLGNEHVTGSWLVQVGGTAAWLEATTGQKYGAEKYLTEALDIARRLSDRTKEAEAMFYQAELAGFHGESQKSERYFREAGSLFAKVEGPRAARLSHYSMGKAALLAAKWQVSGEHFLAGLVIAVEQKDHWDVLHHLAALAVVKVSCPGEEELAARLQGTVDAMSPVTHIFDYSITILYFPFHSQRVLTAAKSALGEMRCAAAYAEGQSMTIEQAAAFVLASS